MKASPGSEFPHLPGVYLFKDQNGRIIFIGKARSLKERVSSYFKQPADSPKTAALLKQYKKIDFIVAATELEALILESQLIKKHLPQYNVQWRDDKRYPYLKLTLNEEWPRLEIVRKTENDEAEYFGPYEAKSAKDTLRLIRKIFPLRFCKETPLKPRQQPCLYYYLKQCWGPCSKQVSREEYLKLSQAIAAILEGDLSSAISRLKEEMKIASSALNFERAARLRDQIRSLSRLSQRRPEWKPARVPKEGDTSSWELKIALSLQRAPKRIEAFDVSNIGDENIVASMVVFLDGRPYKSDYRKFKIRGIEGPNDVAAIQEAVYRRYSGALKKMKKPNLILIDGGKAQLNAALKALTQAQVKVPVISLAKREEEVYSPKLKSPLKLPADSPARLLLERVRDEAHRFAISYHRSSRRLTK